MTRFQVLGAVALALLTPARDATAQRGGGAVRSGARGAVVGGLVGGESGAATGAKVGVVTGAARSVGQEAQARAQYQATPAYQSAPHSDFNQVPPAVLGTVPPAATVPAGGDCPAGGDRSQRRGCHSEEWKAPRCGHTPRRLEAGLRSQLCLRR